MSLFPYLLALSLITNGSAPKEMTSESSPQFLYKVLSSAFWKRNRNESLLELPAMDTPFIHLSTKEQMIPVIKKFFIRENEVFVLKLDVKKLPGRLLHEKNPGGESLYYHLYDGYIPQSAIADVERLIPREL